MGDANTIARALELQGEGSFTDAAAIYQGLLGTQPENPDLLNLFGGLLVQMGKPAEALGVIGEAIRLDPARPDYYRTLAAAKAGAGQAGEAAGIHLELGVAQQGGELWDAALADYDAGLRYDPANPHLHNNRGTVLRRLGRAHDALLAFTGALDADPAMYAALSNRGNVRWEGGDIAGALRDHRAALALAPDDPQLRVNLAVVLREDGQLDEALAEYDRALIRKPGYAAAHYDRGQLLAQMGRLAEGFADMEWRWDPSYGYKEPARPYRQPVWRSEPASEVKGALLVTSEQGYGDTIQFSRYAPLLVARGYEVVLEVQQPLLRLFQEGFDRPGLTVVSRTPAPVSGLKRLFGGGKPPGFAAHVGMLSLPCRLGTTLQSVPGTVPYLSVPQPAVQRWRDKLATGLTPATDLKVGLVWQGDPGHRQDRTRSLDPRLLEPLVAQHARCRFYSLQKGVGESHEFAGARVPNLGGEFVDFQDTAAAILNLDLVITVDTAVAHLAGALGKPVWILLTKVGEWRWLTGTDRSPWYPTARMFRQDTQGDWGSVITRVAAALGHL